MLSTFWVPEDKIDAEQRQAVQAIGVDESFLLKGPAGCGKTNILLLRAKNLKLKKVSNFKIVVFTSSLRQFLEAGCEQYGIDPAAVVTQMTFFKQILEEYSVSFELSKDFETDRSLLAGKVLSLIESGRIPNTYCSALLVDEAQDYTDTELLVFRGLTQRLVLASDSRQSIYKATHTPDLPEQLVGKKVVTLRYHYRSGLNLCKVADAILTDSNTYPRVQDGCKYPEAELPSTVIPVPCNTFEDQINTLWSNLDSQLSLYPGQTIGVLFPKREQLNQFLENFDVPKWVRADTLHGAKGWEFRAVHIAGCEVLPRMGAVQKRLIYTGILRGKTSAHVYFSGHLPGYLDAALAVLSPPPAEPSFDDLLRGT